MNRLGFDVPFLKDTTKLGIDVGSAIIASSISFVWKKNLCADDRYWTLFAIEQLLSCRSAADLSSSPIQPIQPALQTTTCLHHPNLSHNWTSHSRLEGNSYECCVQFQSFLPLPIAELHRKTLVGTLTCFLWRCAVMPHRVVDYNYCFICKLGKRSHLSFSLWLIS